LFSPQIVHFHVVVVAVVVVVDDDDGLDTGLDKDKLEKDEVGEGDNAVLEGEDVRDIFVFEDESR